MKNIILLLCLVPIAFAGNGLDVKSQLLIIPYPSKVSFNSTSSSGISFGSDISYKVTGKSCDEKCTEFLKDNFNHTISFPLKQQEGLSNFRISLFKQIDIQIPTPTDPKKVTEIEVELLDDQVYPDLNLETNNTYSLEINEKGIKVSASNVYGIRNSFETLIQLARIDGNNFFISQLPISIRDTPRFKWRGLLVDPSRNDIPPQFFYRIVDAMAAFKSNMMHIHLSDCQQFTFESKAFPDLHLKGLHDQKFLLTQDFIKKLSAYGKKRGVIIYGEIDVPSHTASWSKGYPDTVSDIWDFLKERKTRYGENVISLNPSNQTTFEIIEKLVGELSETFDSDFVHIGGDEVFTLSWIKSKQIERIKAFMAEKNLKDYKELDTYFNEFAINKVKENKKTPVVFEEVFEKKLPDKSVIIQVWNKLNLLKEVVSKGYKTFLSSGFYLDKQMPKCVEGNPDPNACVNSNYFYVWTYRDMYYMNPTRDLTEEEKKLFLGIEACSWGENADHNNFFDRVFQRFAAVAERNWSPENLRNAESLEVRADHFRCLGLRRGILNGTGPLYHSLCELPHKK